MSDNVLAKGLAGFGQPVRRRIKRFADGDPYQMAKGVKAVNVKKLAGDFSRQQQLKAGLTGQG
eukprot:10010070-Lingulodinium_polyedra.AAC.1